MKRKLFSIGVIIMLLASMLMMAGPASAATLEWSVQPTPSALFNQVAANTDVANVVVAPNGDIFALDATSANLVYKSIDGGRTWSKSLTVPLPSTCSVVDIAVSPSYATDSTVFALSGGAAVGQSQVYISTNGGVSFAVLGGALTTGEIATSIAVAPNYSGGTGEVMVGTQAAAAGAHGNVYIWGRNGVLNWTATGLIKDVMEVAYSPNYAIDATRLAVAASTATGTTLDTMIATGAWNAGSIPVAAVVDVTVNGTGAPNPISAANIAFPSDFNASLAFNRTAYVALQNGGAINNNVFRVTVGLGAAVAMNPLALYGLTDHPMTSIVYEGTAAVGTLFAGGGVASTAVMRCANPSASAAAITWAPAVAAPSGTGTVWLAKANDFATSNKLYAGTTGPNSALSISDDGGIYFYQSGMIDSAILTIDDFLAVNTNELFLSTNDNAGLASVWKSSDAGATWFRQLSPAVTGAGILRASPNYDTDMTVFWGDTTGTMIQISNNKGSSWTPRTSPIAIGDIAVKDQYTFYIGGSAAGSVQSSNNGGWTYQAVPTTVATTGGPGAIIDIDIDIATGHLLVGGDNGSIYLSTDGNIKYTVQSLVGIGGNVLVAFDSGYSTNNFIYAGSTNASVGGTASVKRFQVGSYTNWTGLGDGTPASCVNDLVSAPDGTLYVSDNTVGAGIHRSIDPTAGFENLSLAGWDAIGSAFDKLGATSRVKELSVAAGSNVVYGIDVVNLRVYSYTDTLTQAAPNPTAPEPEAILDSRDTMFSWDAVAGATLYDVQYCLRADWVGSTIVTTTNLFDAFLATTGNTFLAGKMYYWRVRANSPVLGPWSEVNTFTAQLSTTAPTSPTPAGAVEGGTNAGGWNASLTPSFFWIAVKAATGYEFQLSASSDFSGALIVDMSGANALGPVNTYTLTTPLAYNTTYYWRVKALGAAATTDWSSIVPFTTMAEPEETTPPVTVPPAQPAPTITIPPAPAPTTITIPPAPEPDQIAPGYIWAVIIIGAVLVIALIVLIVRTRRSV